MKKLIIILFLLITSFLLLTSCAYTDSIHVVFISETGAIVDEQDVTLTHAINTPELNYTREGLNFRGWVLNETDTSPKIKPGVTLRYNILKNYTDTNSKYIKMYALWLEKAELCVGWDATEASGLDDEYIKALKSNMTAAISENLGYDITINFRAYEYTNSDSISEATANITKHGDVDIVLGFHNKINKPSYGNLGVRKFIDTYNCNGKVRTLGTLNNKDLTIYAYNWLLEQSTIPRTSEHDLAIAWGWNGVTDLTKVNGTTAVDYTEANALLTGLKEYLSENGYNDVDIVLEPVRNTPVNEETAETLSNGKYDILVNFGSNIPNFIAVTKQKTVSINGYNRINFMMNSGNDLVNLAWKYINSEAGITALTKETKTNITIACDMRSTSGLTSEIVNDFKTALNAYIQEQQLPYTVTIKEYNIQSTADLGAQIKADGCDLVIGMGSNFNSQGNLTFYGSKTCIINGTEGRRILLLVNNDEAIEVYNWILSSGFASLRAE